MSGPAGAPVGGRRPDLRWLNVEDSGSMHGLELVVFPDDPWSREQLAEELSHPASRYIGAFADGRLIGAGGIKGVFDADLMTVGVLPDHRGRGIGTMLVEALIEHCREVGIERIFLEVRESNAAAVGLYEHLGFHEIGRVRDYYRNPTEAALTMRLDLSA